jgi:hypothetical protein
MIRRKTRETAQGIKKEKENRREKIIVSFTSIGARIRSIKKMVMTLFDQALMADEIRLVVSEDPYRGDAKRGLKRSQIPLWLKRLEAEGRIKIVFTENIGPYTKLIPTLKEYYTDMQALIITCDDDTLYPYDWILNLYKGHLDKPDSIVAYRCRHIQILDGQVNPYLSWNLISPGNEARQLASSFPFNILPTGKNGILYRPAFFPELMFDRAFADLSPFNDDLWARFITILNNVPVHIVQSDFSFHRDCFRNTKACKIRPLYNINLSKNDGQIDKILSFLSTRGLLGIGKETFVKGTGIAV